MILGGSISERRLKTSTKVRATLVLIFLVFLGSGWVAAGQPVVLQPSAYSSSQRTALAMATAGLERVLEDRGLGPQIPLGERGWTSDEFAALAAGSLAQMGYETAVVSAEWPGGRHAWVLVGVDVGGATAWIPIEATPLPGTVQRTLGDIAWGSGGVAYDDRYRQFDQVVDVGDNAAPRAILRLPTAAPIVGETVTFLALSSHDPDGQIFFYLWNVDGAPKSVISKTWSYDHVFQDDGRHTVTLTVIDDRGGRDSTHAIVSVYRLDAQGKREISGTCVPCSN